MRSKSSRGESQLRTFIGLLFITVWILWISLSEIKSKFVPLGKNCRKILLRFSICPFSQLWYGAQKKLLQFNILFTSSWLAFSVPLSYVILSTFSGPNSLESRKTFIVADSSSPALLSFIFLQKIHSHFSLYKHC